MDDRQDHGLTHGLTHGLDYRLNHRLHHGLLDVAGRWQTAAGESGRLPLTVALAAFVGAFLVTRVITRLIRAGRGPFRNVRPGGLHIHHVVPGVVLTVVGGFWAVGVSGEGVARCLAAGVFGAGAGLVLDEFALILHLQDVYWSREGRASIEAITLTVAAVGAVLSGFNPLGVDSFGDLATAGRGTWIAVIVADLLCAAVAFAKGKMRLGVLGLFVPVLGLVAAIRLARPGSPWAARRYRDRPAALARAERRTASHDARWRRLRTWFQDTIAGAPTHTPDDDNDRPDR
ncbi:hypothetical protein MOV08_04325 [Streptomyces yunnanensis]|uniref:Integral membrane protein n=1 Tax=Streptomyces yunnanensis TaxID=156453 RepID=A0ABY8A3X6_9ACTN|nr:hypothetical protein [Streptomyces yunnanensis]WEB38595.1 hypothetical protein MOV08_04325 [Streptomyces yunnanensis]